MENIMEQGTGGDTEQSTTGSGDVLIVVSKLKNYVKNKSGLNTSNSVAQVLSESVRRLCDQAIEKAKMDGRKTVMDRDF